MFPACPDCVVGQVEVDATVDAQAHIRKQGCIEEKVEAEAHIGDSVVAPSQSRVPVSRTERSKNPIC